MCSESNEDCKYKKNVCKSRLYRLYKSGKDFIVVDGNLYIIKKTNINMFETTKAIIAVLVVIAAIVTLFVSVNELGSELIRWASGIVIGYYFAGSTLAAKILGSKMTRKH